MTPWNLQRRRWVAAVVAATAGGVVPRARAQAQGLGLVEVAEGGFRFLPGNPVFAVGAAALPGFAVVHAVLDRWLPLDEGYTLVESHLAAVGRPLRALCGMELRLPRQLSFEEFQAFNGPYVERLIRWGVLVDGRNPVSRTNVAPVVEPPEAPSLHAFSYTVPVTVGTGGFVMSGVTENGPAGVVAAGDTSSAGMLAKAEYLVVAVGQRLARLGVSFRTATHVEIYCSMPLDGEGAARVLPAFDLGVRRGVRWHCGRPPVTGLELELEARRVASEIVVET